MRKTILALLGAIVCCAADLRSPMDWKPLLDAKLSQFDVYLSYRGDQIMSVLAGQGARRTSSPWG